MYHTRQSKALNDDLSLSLTVHQVSETRGLNDDLSLTLTVHQVAETRRPMIVELTLIWRPENIICNMTSASLIGQSINDLVSATS